jgi:hypothetical protein
MPLRSGKTLKAVPHRTRVRGQRKNTAVTFEWYTNPDGRLREAVASIGRRGGKLSGSGCGGRFSKMLPRPDLTVGDSIVVVTRRYQQHKWYMAKPEQYLYVLAVGLPGDDLSNDIARPIPGEDASWLDDAVHHVLSLI